MSPNVDRSFHMDTGETVSESRSGGGPAELAHYSTGRLTRRQADTVNAWRALLVPTEDPLEDRPRASRSDAIAAAVTDLLREPPAPLEVARYAYAGMAAQLADAYQKADPDIVPLYPPVSWYLPGDTAQQAGQLRAAAHSAAIAEYETIAAEAQRRHPQPGQAGDIARAMFALAELGRRGLPPRPRQIPRGTLARMAIDRWAARDPRQVVTAAIEHAQLTHIQLHRARRDMRTLKR
jgi:hypothetical protein